MASKRRRTVMTVKERVKCIRLCEAGHKVKNIQETLGVGKTQIYEKSPDVKPPSSKRAMEMASKMLLYAQESPDISDDQRDSFLQLATKLYDTQTNIFIQQRMKPTQQLKIDSFFPKSEKNQH